MGIIIAQYALANGADVINGVHIYPQFTLWEIIDPERSTSIYITDSPIFHFLIILKKILLN